MFVKFRGSLGFRDLRWDLTHDVLDELNYQATNTAYRAAYVPIASLALWPSREAIRKGVKNVC